MRMRLTAAAAAIVILGTAAQAQQFTLPPPAPPPDFDKIAIRTTDLGNQAYMLEGQGGNITVVVASDGVFVVDTQFAPLYGKIKAAIAAVTPLPVRYVINSHFHGDHVGSNESFAKDGAIIVAHENLKTRLVEGARNSISGLPVPPAPALGVPKQTYKDTLTLRLQGRTAELKHPPNVHTEGDTYVYFPEVNVLAAGDLFFANRFPNIDYLYGGSIDGQIRGADELLQLVKEDTKIVAGHGVLGTKAMLRDWRQMLIETRDRIQKLKAAGKTEDEIIAARPNADYDAKYNMDERAIANFIRVVYRSTK
jgi:glyoxylase-like metal-dependent hydrolase (beta-lactamase superfamily II)